jgi:hypothetical protein
MGEMPVAMLRKDLKLTILPDIRLEIDKNCSHK